jgi:hypothetical protein
MHRLPTLSGGIPAVPVQLDHAAEILLLERRRADHDGRCLDPLGMT